MDNGIVIMLIIPVITGIAVPSLLLWLARRPNPDKHYRPMMDLRDAM